VIRRAARLIVGAVLALSGGVVALFIVAACDERFMTHEEIRRLGAGCRRYAHFMYTPCSR